ncbi:MAG: hypothetical protein KDA61_02375 [Planctomycetales bacterium]|nr:hypothetical protein [Planctomycetales bacterium]
MAIVYLLSFAWPNGLATQGRGLQGPLLLADWDDALRAIVPIIFMILYGIAQLLGSRQEGGKAAPPRRRPLPPPDPARKAGGNLEETLRQEVEQFLQRTKGQQPQSVERRPPSPPKPEPPRRLEPAPDVKPRRVAQPRMPQEAQVGQRPIPPAAPRPGATKSQSVPPVGDSTVSVAQHVREHIGAAERVGQHAEALGDDVALADERMEQHLRERFVHQVGTLKRQAESQSTAPKVKTPAAEMLELLQRPNGIRQVIVAAEILKRPEF